MNNLIHYNKFMKRIIFFTVFLIALVFLGFMYFVQTESINNNLKSKNDLFVDLVFENLYTTMKKGGNIHEIETLVKKLETKAEHINISIHRFTDEVEEDTIKEIFSTKETVIYKHNNHVDFAKPIVYKNECMSCHTSSSVGDVAAVMQVEMPYLEIDLSLKDILVSVVFLFISSVFIIFLIWYVYFRKIFIAPLEKIVKQMSNISSHSDLDESIKVETNIKELKDIEDAFNKQAEQLKESFENIKDLSNTDVLTKINNRKKFVEDIEDLMHVCRRYGQVFTIISIDLNDFKPVNDMYGHNIGDLVLKEFTRLVEINIRESDRFYRIGGDEFILLLTNTESKYATIVIENLRKALKKLDLNINGNTLKVSASFGTCEFTDEIDNLEQLLVIADTEMYKDKLNIKQRF